MSVSTPWTNSTPGSTARNNKVTTISDTGDNLTDLDISEFRVVFCTEDGGQFVKDHTYTANADEDAWIDITEVAEHSHSSDSDGGSIINLFKGNPTFTILQLTKTNDLKKAQWIETTGSGGTIEDATDGTTGERSIRLRTNTTSGGNATIAYPHLKLSFANDSMFQAKLRLESTTSLAFHTGIACDDITAADSNTRKLQAEVCTTTNSNWWLRTATGSANNAADTGVAITTNRTKIRIRHLPNDVEAWLLIDANTEFQKTSNIPTGGETADNNIIKHSIKNSTTADKPLHVYSSRVYYNATSEWV
jgi:hypothetical protein